MIAERLYLIPDRSLPGSIPNPKSPDFDLLQREKNLLKAVAEQGPGEKVADHLEAYLRGGGRAAYEASVDHFHRVAIINIAKSLGMGFQR
jgi:hypothetical protein